MLIFIIFKNCPILPNDAKHRPGTILETIISKLQILLHNINNNIDFFFPNSSNLHLLYGYSSIDNHEFSNMETFCVNASTDTKPYVYHKYSIQFSLDL